MSVVWATRFPLRRSLHEGKGEESPSVGQGVDVNRSTSTRFFWMRNMLYGGRKQNEEKHKQKGINGMKHEDGFSASQRREIQQQVALQARKNVAHLYNELRHGL